MTFGDRINFFVCVCVCMQVQTYSLLRMSFQFYSWSSPSLVYTDEQLYCYIMLSLLNFLAKNIALRGLETAWVEYMLTYYLKTLTINT